MDEMRIVSKFTRGIISKAIKMVIRKKTGYNIDIQLNEAITTINDGMMLSRLVDTFFSRTSWTMLLYAENHSISVA